MPFDEEQADNQELPFYVGDDHFLQSIFRNAVKKRKEAYSLIGDNLKRVCAEEYDELSRRLDRTLIQESCSVRNVLKTRRLANLLINEKGELLLSLIPKAIAHLQEHYYSFGPNRQYDAPRHAQILNVLKGLQTNKELIRIVRTITKPHSHKYADQIIRDTLQLPSNTAITDAHARRAVLSAWMCYLRQNVGSCFATAPAIVVHDEQPEAFLSDLNELLHTGRLKRTFSGIEYSVPLSSSWGAGDLRKPFPLYKLIEKEHEAIWHAPGILAALESIHLIDGNTPIKAKTTKAKELVKSVVAHWGKNAEHMLITPEQILRSIVMSQLNLTEQDLVDFENRPKDMIFSGLLLQVPKQAAGSGGKGEACMIFYERFETASNAFKALADNALLKSWEFTVASFAETKANFTRWNLYSSLGLGADEVGGIGHRLYEIIKRKLDICNEKMHAMQNEYELAYHALKSLEARMRSASTEKEVQWLKIEHQSRLHEFYTLEEIRNDAHYKGQRFANLFNEIVQTYDKLFPVYFQEIYDADMHEIIVGPYDDSPAGFRLIYKHGRANTSQWTPIKNHQEFIDSLANFFVATEPEISATPEYADLKDDIAEIVTVIVNHVKTPEFLESAFYRMAAVHKSRIVKNPLQNLDKIEKKPWAYTSGGSMSSLVSSYFSFEQKPVQISRWVENPMELLVFLVDGIKQLPPNVIKFLSEGQNKSLLMHSPTHAFLLKPWIPSFRQAWQTDAFTYTWLRDQFVQPAEKFIRSMDLDPEVMEYILGQLVELVPKNFRHNFQKTFAHPAGLKNPIEFRHYITDTMARDPGLRFAGRPVLYPDEIDSFLYSMLPLCNRQGGMNCIEELIRNLDEVPKNIREKALAIFNTLSNSAGSQPYISSKALQDTVKALICLAYNHSSCPFDISLIIAKNAQRLRFAMPAPIQFADTNWVKDEFGFTVNPGTGRFELWRFDYTGTVGFPMAIWEQWLNGSRQDIPWGVYTRPHEYTAKYTPPSQSLRLQF